MPLFVTKKEVFEWLKQGLKTIDVRRGGPHNGQTAVFQSGPHVLRLRIIKKETAKLTEVVREDNYKLVIPSAQTLEEAVVYLRKLYGDYDDCFTAYYVKK